MILPPSPASMFATPTAEQESWLSEVFVRQPVFEQLMDTTSTIVYGASGSGKTALRLSLQQAPPDQVLVVPWSPEPITEMTAGTPLAQAALRQAIQALVERIVQTQQIPERLRQSSSWASVALVWFMREYLSVDDRLLRREPER